MKRVFGIVGIFMAKGKKCPQCGQWTMHEKKPGYWYCSNCGAVTFGDPEE